MLTPGSDFVVGDGEEDAIHRGSIQENGHWSGAASDFAKALFNGIGGADGFALGSDLMRQQLNWSRSSCR